MSVWPRWLAAVLVAFGFLAVAATGASAETRSLKLYHLHTGEKAEIVYKRNGRYDQAGLRKINIILRDWRRNEPTKMDPRLLDLVWEAYRESRATDYIQVVCGYRSPATNSMLRSRSRGVAKESQHMLGKAMDFYIPGVPLKKLRNIGLKMQGGGVGYYPTSGSPFVHLDVGNVRHWPGISRQELVSLFPNGKTLHVPSDGRPLPGYQQALASYKSRKGSGGAAIELASAGGGSKKSGGLLSAFFGGGDDEADDSSDVASASPAPKPRDVKPVLASTAKSKHADSSQIAEEQVPEPENVTPETIIAALPARAVPVPEFAPRPTNVYQAPSELLALASTAEFDKTATGTVLPPSPPAPARPDGVKSVLDEANLAIGQYQIASLTMPSESSSAFANLSGVEAASPHKAISAQVEPDPAAVLGTGVKTTPKEPRPTARDLKPGPKSVAVAAEPQAARWALNSGERVATVSSPTTAPRYAYNLVHTSPSEIYMTGFQTGNEIVEANRFAGNAVQFLSVARFQTQ
ncbi:YcbK family protein [Mesorhizobium sp. M7A.F.Ca.US.008.03.1.1]|uniref:DUF882 domain-containing protein n=1 Tax=Mesorhizobium sp. M7A.F.Ca.US.008.03.1.1 TaxID=2496742 RepID=UPI000FCAB0D9|nr:YcbK family protein [Mesorhizobium sp. M7A.F.Ca.US.008.03.1.1]RUW60714.1 DUF882 domain-containing protein [Mesorhizobium sp. M7A.F.Ca.US.008.03.1.1]